LASAIDPPSRRPREEEPGSSDHFELGLPHPDRAVGVDGDKQPIANLASADRVARTPPIVFIRSGAVWFTFTPASSQASYTRFGAS